MNRWPELPISQKNYIKFEKCSLTGALFIISVMVCYVIALPLVKRTPKDFIAVVMRTCSIFRLLVLLQIVLNKAVEVAVD